MNAAGGRIISGHPYWRTYGTPGSARSDGSLPISASLAGRLALPSGKELPQAKVPSGRKPTQTRRLPLPSREQYCRRQGSQRDRYVGRKAPESWFAACRRYAYLHRRRRRPLPQAGVRCLEDATEGKQSGAQRRTERKRVWKGSTAAAALCRCRGHAQVRRQSTEERRQTFGIRRRGKSAIWFLP